MATLDYGWFVLLAFASAFLPYSPPLRETVTLATKTEVLGNMGEVVISREDVTSASGATPANAEEVI